MDTVVVPLPWLERTGPCKVNLTEVDLLEMCDPRIGQVGAVVAEVFLDEPQKLVGLFFVHLRRGQAKRLESSGFAVGLSDDVRRGFVGDDGDFALLSIERLDQGPCGVFLGSKHLQTFAWAIENRAGVRAEKGRRQSADMAIDHGETQRQVVPLEAPAPGAFDTWLAEDADEVPLRVAGKSALRVGIVQNLLEAHDLCCFLHATGAQHRGQKRVGHVLLILLHLAERQPVARVHLGRDKVPASAVGVIELERRLVLLLRLERREEGVGRVGHVCRSDLVRVGNGTGRERQRQSESD